MSTEQIEKTWGKTMYGINLEVAKGLLEVFGGDDTDMTIAFGDGHSGVGFYAWCSEYPEEGSYFLGRGSE